VVSHPLKGVEGALDDTGRYVGLEQMVLEEPLFVWWIIGLDTLEHELRIANVQDLGDMGLLFNFSHERIDQERKEGFVRMTQQILALHLTFGGFPGAGG